ncbi:hypothetical protein [Streptomyces sp. NPDC094468]|uniref:hypothetical protein n=1 Tax=Streptomyces sp. NPDC094468 TaxID=3366066 RepID=UPI00381B764B
MDQGVAALIAAGFGVLGTAVGGAAAVWGAKIGAERSAQAVKQQVRDQTAAEHAHWLRQQRLEAYERFEDNYSQLARLAVRIDGDVSPAADLLRDLAHCSSRIEILGPLEVSFRSVQIATALGVRVAQLHVLRRIQSSDGGEQSEEYSQLVSQLRDESDPSNRWDEYHRGFVQAAQKVMGSHLA